MSLLALFSEKGSPGVTTVALALAAVWPRRVALAELDPAGADLALRLTDPAGRPVIGTEPGLLTLAAAVRANADVAVRDHSQPLFAGDGELRGLVPGVADAEQGAGIASLWPPIAQVLAAVPSGDVLADLGRLHPGSPAMVVAARADVLVGVARADAEGMLRLRDRMTRLLADLSSPAPGRSRRSAVVLVGEDRHAGEAKAAMRDVLAHAGLRVDVAGFVALDPATVADLHRGRITARAERSLLLRSTRALLPSLHSETSAAAVPSGRRLRSQRSYPAGAR